MPRRLLMNGTGDPDHPINESELKGILARMFVGYVVTLVITLVGMGVWVGGMQAQLKANTGRIEEIRTEGSLPVQRLVTSIDVLTVRMDELSKQLDETKRALDGRH